MLLRARPQDMGTNDPSRALLNENFVNVRVDNDHRPDINSRYNVGGWPTTAFLTGHGGLIGGAGEIPIGAPLPKMSETLPGDTDPEYPMDPEEAEAPTPSEGTPSITSSDTTTSGDDKEPGEGK